MKGLFTAVFLILCLFAAGCQKDAAVIIDDTNSSKTPLRMIKAEGKLYYDSGLYGRAEKRCGTMDGRLKRVGEADEVPQNDGECNFDGAAGYQNATSISKELLIDGKWLVFKLFETEELDMSTYKYCFCLNGRLPNAEKAMQVAVLTGDRSCDFEKWSEEVFHLRYKPGQNKYKSLHIAW